MKFTAIILAAGMGTRLRPLTNEIPKGLVAVGGIPLLHRDIAFIRALEPERIIVVAGYAADLVKESLHEFAPDVQVIVNDQYEQGSVISLLRGIEGIHGSFIQFNADHIYTHSLLLVVKKECQEISAFCDTDRNLTNDDMKVWQENGNVVRMSKTLETYNAGFTGIIFCDESKREIFDASAKKIAAQNPNLGVEHVLNDLADPARLVRVADMSHCLWLEVDTLEDHAKAEAYIESHGEEFLTA